jgi:Dehydrogenases with different specificities (related to short-chain alcohol dehydrogenases)
MGFLEDKAGLTGKVAVITGGAGGLGWPIARDLARAGSHVAICDRDPAALETIAAELASLPVESLLCHADVREPEQVERFFAKIDERFGRVDILVDVPGGGFVAPLMQTTPKGWNAIIRQNFLYVLDTSQQAIRRMQAQGTGGSIIFITSIEAHRAVPNRSIYGAMKAAVTNLAKSLALELGADRIRVNTLAPDIFPTPASGSDASALAPDLLALQQRMAVPMQSYGTGGDLTGCALFLASDLSAYVTGTVLHCDGGTMASSGWFDWPGAGWVNTPPTDALEFLAEPG